VAPPKLDTTLASAKPGTAARTDKATPTAPTTVTVAKAATNKPSTTAPKGQDEDVALLEAMFAHTGRKAAASRPAPPKN
jgi:hypothetical protein